MWEIVLNFELQYISDCTDPLSVSGLCCSIYSVEGTRKCNLYNFSVTGVLPCGIEWWQSKDLAESTDGRAKSIVENALKSFGLNIDDLNTELNKTLTSNSDDPLGKLVESAALLEPYSLYMAADLIKGFGMTAAELEKLKLPTTWTNQQQLIDLYQTYFDKSCDL